MDKENVFFELMKYNYDNFDKRRNLEWKFSLAIWTALAVFAGICVKKENIAIDFNYIKLIFPVITGFIIVGIQVGLHMALFYANDVDKSKAHFYEDIINVKLEIDYKKDPVVQKSLKKNKNRKYMTPIAHGLITIVLVTICITVIFL